MAQETHNGYTFLGTFDLNAPGSITGGFSVGSLNTLTENDGVIDGITGIGGEMISDFGANPAVYLRGFGPGGEPIISFSQTGSGNMYLLGANYSGASVSYTNAGTYPYCFAAGTGIETPDGLRAVEDLTIGDVIVTADGRDVAVKWIGRQTVSVFWGGTAVQPVRIAKGALGADLPHKDLIVTADHGIVLDGLVINASALVNGSTIDFVPLSELPDRMTYYHVETESHDVILAEGTPVETFMDAAGRKGFDNHQEYLDLYGVERLIPEMDRLRITSRRLLPDAIKLRLGIVDPSLGADPLVPWSSTLGA